MLARLIAPALGAALLSVALLLAPTAVSAENSPEPDTAGYLWTAPPEPDTAGYLWTAAPEQDTAGYLWTAAPEPDTARYLWTAPPERDTAGYLGTAPPERAGYLWADPPEPDAKAPPPNHFPWAVTVYTGPFTKQDFLEFFTEPVEFDNAIMVSVAASREFAVLWKHLRWGAEIGVTKWFGDQTNWEFTSAIVVRWATFPWNDYVKTSIAVGDGPSFATQPPKLEKKNFDAAKRVQNYVFLELTFGLPRFPQWDLVIRIHHRSGVFGTLGGSGSSVPALGIKYKF